MGHKTVQFIVVRNPCRKVGILLTVGLGLRTLLFGILGVGTGAGAWVTGRAERQSKKEIP